MSESKPNNFIVKRSELEGLMEGFDSECYALVRPATLEDRKEFRKSVKGNVETSMKFQTTLVASHFISGKLKAYDPDKQEFALRDMTPADLEINAINDRLALDIMGFDLDPKELVAQLPKSELSESNKSTETPSSSSSPSTSQTTPPTN